MTSTTELQKLQQGRYLLFLDILGFTAFVESEEGAEKIYAKINEALQEFCRAENRNKQFTTIYFSDTFIFYQDSKGYNDKVFLDVYAIGGMVLSALLAREIPARGAISFGQFEVSSDNSGKHQIYFGRALIEAYKAEQKENWVGISILKSAWLPYEQANPGNIDCFESNGRWLKRSEDDVLLLNPFMMLRGCYDDDHMGEIKMPYLEWNAPEFKNDILGFKFLRDQATAYASAGDFSGKVAVKYHTTIAFLKQVLGAELYEWGTQISLTDHAMPNPALRRKDYLGQTLDKKIRNV